MAGNKRTALVLQPRDLRLMEALDTMRVIDRQQAKVVAGFNSTTRANSRLLALTRAGFLKRAYIGSRQAVYWLASKPLRDPSHKSRDNAAEPAALFFRHQMEINRATLLVQYRSIPIPAWWFVRWQSFQKPLSASVPLIPDGYFEIQSVQGYCPAFVEIDLGTEAVGIVAKKSGLYLQLAISGEFSQLFGRSQFRVLVVTTSDQRLKNIRAAISKLTDKIFWFATLDVLSPETFWSAAWLRPTGENLQPLL